VQQLSDKDPEFVWFPHVLDA